MASIGISRDVQEFDEKVRAYREALGREQGARQVQRALDEAISQIHRYHGDRALVPGLEEAFRLATQEVRRCERERQFAYERSMGR